MSPSGWFSQPVFIPGGDPEAMNEATLAYAGQLGIRFSYTQPLRTIPTAESGALGSDAGTPKTYKLIKTDSSMAVAPYQGAVAWFKDQTQYLVTTSVTALGRGRIAGIFRNAITPGNFGCIQVKGKAPVKFIDTVVLANVSAVGNFVIPSSTDGKADVTAAGTAPTYPVLGRTAGSIQGGASLAMVDLDVPEVL